MLPVAGTALVWAPAAIALYAGGRPGWALFMLLWGAVVVGSIDNFLRPRLIFGRAEISTLPVFFGVLGGVAAFGLIGLFVGPLIIALALALVARLGSNEDGQITLEGENDPATIIDMLLAKARAGALKGFTGIGNDYQPPTDAELHRIRISAKRCRYAAEVVEPIARRKIEAAGLSDRVTAVCSDLLSARA